MDIQYLADCPNVIPQLAAWFKTEWPDEVGENAEQRFQRCTKKDEIPIALVAFHEALPIGTVALLSTSVHSHNHLKPWIGGLYVVPERRHEGVASQLIDAALGAAHQLGAKIAYVGIQTAREFYESHGWVYLEDGKAGNDTVMVLKKSLSDND